MSDTKAEYVSLSSWSETTQDKMQALKAVCDRFVSVGAHFKDMEAVFSAAFQKDGGKDTENVVQARGQLADAHEAIMRAGKDYDDAWNAVLAPVADDAMTEAWNGIPLNPEQDGYHWLSHHGEAPEPHRWCRSSRQRNGTTRPGTWLCLLFKTRTPQWAAENGYAYVSPCIAPCGANEDVASAHMEGFLADLYSR